MRVMREPISAAANRRQVHKGQDMDENENENLDKSIAFLLHELRQPLNMIILSCANIQNRAGIDQGRIDGDYVITKTNGIMSSVSKAADIIDKIEAFEKNRTRL